MNGSRRLALQFYQHLALLPQTILLVWAPSSILSPACLLLYPETMRDSFKLCVALPQHSSCHVPLHHCDLFHHLNFCHGSFHAVSCIFVFWMIRKWWVAPVRAMFILLMRFYSIKRLGSLTFLRYTLRKKLDCNNGWDDKMGWCGCLITYEDWGETIKDNHTAVPSCTSFNSVTVKEW